MSPIPEQLLTDLRRFVAQRGQELAERGADAQERLDELAPFRAVIHALELEAPEPEPRSLPALGLCAPCGAASYDRERPAHCGTCGFLYADHPNHQLTCADDECTWCWMSLARGTFFNRAGCAASNVHGSGQDSGSRRAVALILAPWELAEIESLNLARLGTLAEGHCGFCPDAEPGPVFVVNNEYPICDSCVGRIATALRSAIPGQ